MEAFDIVLGLNLFEIETEEDETVMNSSSSSTNSSKKNVSSQAKPDKEKPLDIGLDLGRSGIFVFSPPKEEDSHRREEAAAAAVDFEEEIALQSLTSQELEKHISQHVFDSNSSTATDASISSCASEKSDVSLFAENSKNIKVKVLGELKEDTTAKVIEGIDLTFGTPLIQMAGKINEGLVDRGLPTIDTSKTPLQTAPPVKPKRTCTRKEANILLGSLMNNDGGGGGRVFDDIAKEAKKAGEARRRSWLEWFVRVLVLAGVAFVTGYAMGVGLVAIGCSATFAALAGLIAACGVGSLGYTFFLAKK